MHILSITSGNKTTCKTLTLQDASYYDPISPVQNIILEVKAPGQSCFTTFNLLNGWCSKTFSCVDFKLCCISDEISVLPDGIYEIKYSVDPNLATMIEINHMRICQLMTTYIKTIGLFLSNKCNYKKSEVIAIEKELIEIKFIIDNSVYAVEELLNNTSGLELYNEASHRLNKINNGNFSSCCK